VERITGNHGNDAGSRSVEAGFSSHYMLGGKSQGAASNNRIGEKGSSEGDLYSGLNRPRNHQSGA